MPAYYKVCADIDGKLVSIAAGLHIFPGAELNAALLYEYQQGIPTVQRPLCAVPGVAGLYGVGLCVYDNMDAISRLITAVLHHRPHARLRVFRCDVTDPKVVTEIPVFKEGDPVFSGNVGTILVQSVTLREEYGK